MVMTDKKRPNGDFEMTARVKSELEQDTSPSQWHGIATWLGKVVERGWQIFIKSFWETIFDRVWPK
jgi:hypothetical protein